MNLRPFASLCLQTDCQPRAGREKGLTLGAFSWKRTNQKETEPNTMLNKVILIGRLGQNAESKTAQNNREYVVLNIAAQESWKNDQGDYETRTEWHRVYAWGNLSKFARTLQKGQLVTLEGTLRYREVEDEVEGTRFKHRIAEIHAIDQVVPNAHPETTGVRCHRCAASSPEEDARLRLKPRAIA